MASSWQMGRLPEAEGHPHAGLHHHPDLRDFPIAGVVDITNRVTDLIRESGIQVGLAVVFSRHTTGAIRINEMEPLLL